MDHLQLIIVAAQPQVHNTSSEVVYCEIWVRSAVSMLVLAHDLWPTIGIALVQSVP